jgi:hypothetical protein
MLEVGGGLIDGATKKELDDGQTGRCVMITSGAVQKAIFKPTEGENFRRQGLDAGQGAVREEAAYVIDRITGALAGVPVTVRARMDLDGTPTKGAMQQFVTNDGPVEDFGMPRDLEQACARLSIVNAQAVAALDIRIANTDRHGGNLLVKGTGPASLVPIDHGCAFPPWWGLGELIFDAWLSWPQVDAPVDPTVKEAIAASLRDLQTTIADLREAGLDEPALLTVQICTRLLASGVQHGKTLGAIARVMLREDFEEPSWLERQVEGAAVDLPCKVEFKPDDKYGDPVMTVEPQGPPWESGSADAFLANLDQRFDSHWAS